MKQCSKCKEWKDESEFHKDKRTRDGVYPQCKICKNKRTREYFRSEAGKEYNKSWQKRFRQTEQGKEYYKKYANSEKGKETRKRFEQSKKGKAKASRNRRSEKYKARHRVANRQYQINNPEKINAQSAVKLAVEKGKLPHVSTLSCVKCGNQAVHYHHHNGYTQQSKLDVIPVCAKCHSIIHASERTRNEPQ